jgi:hypothetical protein
MNNLTRTAALSASVLAMALAPAAAMASGKLAGGGATGGGGGGSTTTTVSGAGSGGGGGGGGGGQNRSGVNDTTVPAPPPPPPPAPATTPCATLTSVTAPVGYYLTYAALWNDYTVRSCADGLEDISVHVTNTDRSDGSVDYDVTVPYSLLAGQNASGVLDNDFAPFNTDYDVKIEALDQSGNVLDSSSTVATTPPPR